ncbi:MAG TPA: glycoside hydrolase family 3 C-terminal domain-containing protein [Mycobacteriales bacterium]|nr:glycoside hydrolase family 3 C-terminal domain-containing protein [Mycobacteriales bacterium]
MGGGLRDRLRGRVPGGAPGPGPRGIAAAAVTMAIAVTGCAAAPQVAAHKTTTVTNPTGTQPVAVESRAGGGSADAGSACTPKHFRLLPISVAARKARHLVGRMTLKQEVDLMHGVGYGSPAGTVGATAPIPGLKIPALNQEDGPGGIGDGDQGVTQLPAPIALAATFDPAAARCYGQVIGTEARGKGINLVYGPTVNLVRVPQWGRAFESFGEDPVLSGLIGRSVIDGIQRSGVMAQAKHFAVYNQEAKRNTPADDAIVAQRTLQEVYLKMWRLLLKADPSSVMCSYSTINGTAACQNKSLLTGFLRHQIGYQGFIGSDYGATHSTVRSVKAGLEQEQPETTYFASRLVHDVRDGTVARRLVDDAATRILTQMYRFRMFTDDPKPDAGRVVTDAAHAKVARRVAEESAVLLKNAGGTLPLAGTGSIAVIGPAAGTDTVSVGDGSATVASPGTVTPLAGIRAKAPSGTTVSYTAGLPADGDLTAIPAADLSPAFPSGGTTGKFSATLTAPTTGTYILGYTAATVYKGVTLTVDGKRLVDNPGTPPVSTYTTAVHFTAGGTHHLTISGPAGALTWATPDVVSPDISAAVSAAASASTAVVVVGDGQESEAAERASLDLPSAQNQLVRAVAAANPRTVVVVEAGAAVAMPWLAKVRAVLDQWDAGQTDGASLAAVLFGAVDPSGHLPVTFPISLSTTPVASPARYPGVHGKVHYTEGRNIGYRWWLDTHHTPLFPFGYGLSYTRFHYGTPKVSVHEATGHPVVTVRERVRNIGSVAGADVAQLYLAFPAAAHEPDRQLAAFHRVSLAPGHSATLTFHLHGVSLAYYSGDGWRIATGRFGVYVGDSAARAELSARAGFRITRGGRLS